MPRRAPSGTTGHLWIEEGDQREGMIAEVAPVVAFTHQTYSFAVPASMEAMLSLGRRVLVPLRRGGQLVQGFVVNLDRGVWDSTLRPIDAVVDAASFLTPELITLGREIARHYVCPLGRTLKALTPEAVRQERGLRTVRYARLKQPLEQIRESGERVTAKRQAILEMLAGAAEPIPVERLRRDLGASSSVLRDMEAKGWIEITKRKEVDDRADPAGPPLQEPGFELNDEQRGALESINGRIDARSFSVTLLFGVSGSGKTEVYIQAIRRVVAAGGQAILLVPEIVLTTQLVQRLAARFADVAVNHSGLTDARRSLMWRQVEAGDKKVVIGTRSAVFAPCPRLGLICVDEEQETSYKNLQAPRFHVRDVAIMRAKLRGIPIVLGSATPSIESWSNSVHHGDWQRLVIRRRVKALPMPKVYIIDMRDEHAELKRGVILSRSMERLLGETLERGEQGLILINRRGFATRVYCPACKARIECPNCSAGLVVHASTGEMLCHYCRRRTPMPTVCPSAGCGEPLVQLGLGTQRVEGVLAERFPQARIERVDSDTMKHRRHYQRIVDDFERRKIDVLVGTQMIAKGLDFPFVSFVGVVDADPAAVAGDFRAEERLFQLITQVAGRAGRAGAAGQVVVQTTMPEMPALRFALRHDYESFAGHEIDLRRKVGLPPFRRLSRIVLSHERDATARQEAEALAERITEAISALALESTDVLGPNPCLLARLRGRYRHELLLRTLNASAMRQLLAHLQESKVLRTKAQSMIIDVDPVALA